MESTQVSKTEVTQVPTAQFLAFFCMLEKIEDYILNHEERTSLLNSQWATMKRICEELDVDPKTARKYIKALNWKTTKIGSKIYIDVNSVRESLDSNAR